CSFFGYRHLPSVLKPGRSALFAGKVSMFKRKLQLTNPEFHLIDEDTEDADIDRFLGLLPVYPATANLQTWQIAKCIRQTLDMVDEIDDAMPFELRAKRSLADYDEALRDIHLAKDWESVRAARERLKWDEAMAVQLALALRRKASAARPAPACPRGDGG